MIHPGYGFLSENHEFARKVEAAGIAFIGPRPETIDGLGDKTKARDLAREAGVPIVPGTPGPIESYEEAKGFLEETGFPVIIKAAMGGGGRGMRVVRKQEEFKDAFERAKSEAKSAFGDPTVFIERFLDRPRHIEVQLLADAEGNCVHLFERDCSVQRRHQKVLEETPAPNLPNEVRSQLQGTARALMEAVQYRNAGTVEFILDQDSNAFYFLEVNTRLQVEHGVTEQVFGVDLVEWMVKLAAGDLPPLDSLGPFHPDGHSIQARVYAEDPNKDFQPSAGLLTAVEFTQADGNALRIDHWVEAGLTISPLFDPMLAKVIIHEGDRDSALAALSDTLDSITLEGIETNRDYVRAILADATTDAVLVQLDMLAEQHPNLLFVATSNFPQAVDSAFTSRCDLILHVPLPDRDACARILGDCLEGLSKTYPAIGKLARAKEFDACASECVGLDGRAIRKMVANALASRPAVAMDPGSVTASDLLAAAKSAKTNRAGGKA